MAAHSSVIAALNEKENTTVETFTRVQQQSCVSERVHDKTG